MTRKSKRTERADKVEVIVLQRITPRAALKPFAEKIVAQLAVKARTKRLAINFLVGGSIAKGTNLHGAADVDVFARFNYEKYEKQDDELADLLEVLMPRGAKRVHGSRDYFQFHRTHEGERVLFEVVPVLDISKPDQAVNVTDASPLHVQYVRKALDGTEGVTEQIRLAKQFCKAARCYGAESYVNGFSGHVLDLLIITYGTLRALLRAAATTWKEKVVFDPAGHHKEPLTTLDTAKTGSPLVIVDPVQPMRNAAAALSKERYERFKSVAKEYLRAPDIAFFTLFPVTPNSVKRAYEERRLPKKSLLATIVYEPLEGKEDVVATKLLKAHEHLVANLKRAGFTIREQGWEYNRDTGKATGWFLVKAERLPATKEREGPPLKAVKDAKRFKERHQKTTVRQGRLYARVPRAEREPVPFIKKLLSSPYVQERAVKTSLATTSFS